MERQIWRRAVGRHVALLFGAAAVSLALVSAHASAQQTMGTISGTVADQNGRALAGALILVDGQTVNASSTRDGLFRVANVRSGTQHVTVRYIGFQAETVTVEVPAGGTAHKDIVLKEPVRQLSTIIVESQIAGQAAALNQQRAGANISSVVDAELVGRLPDQNLAEAVGRVPGVALIRDQGEGRFVQIRGMDANLNTLSVDGMRMPTPQGGTRGTPMDVIPSDMISAIRVSKTLTADMEADAIGGNVDLTTRTARKGQPLLSLNVAGGQNRINDGDIKNVTGYIGQRYANNKLGVVLGGNYYQNDRGSQNFEQGWCIETTCTGVTAAQAPDVPTALTMRDYAQVKRTREGFNGTIDYQFNDNNSLFVKGFSSKFEDQEQRFVTTMNFGSGTYTVADANKGSVVGARIDKELRLRPVTQHEKSIQVGGKHVLNGTSIDYAYVAASADEFRPNTLTMVFRQSGVNLTYDVSDEDRPAYTVTKGSEFNSSLYNYNSLRQQTRDVNDDQKTVKLNLSRPFSVGSKTGTFKIGGLMRRSTRASIDTSNRFLNSFKTGMPAPSTPLNLGAVEGRKLVPDFVDGRFNIGPEVSADAVSAFWEYYQHSINQDTTRSNVESNSGNIWTKENVTAGYAMATIDAGRLRLIPGVRIERTTGTNTGNKVTQVGQVVTITPVVNDVNYTHVFPSITANFAYDDQTIIRAAATRSLVRPAFASMAPFITIPDGTSGLTASIGNPNLRPTTSTNLDLMAERYFRSVGYMSIGVFHKSLKDFIFPETRPATADDNLGAAVTTVSQPVNGETGSLNGFEVAWQQNLTFLPGVLAGLGVNANYTRTSSSTTIPTREGFTADLPGQAGNAANLGLFFERSALSLRVGYNFSDKYLEVIGASPLTDIYVASRNQLDVSGSYRLTPSAKIFVETNNLTNQPLRRYIGKPERGWQPGGEFYRPWATVGIRVQQ